MDEPLPLDPPQAPADVAHAIWAPASDVRLAANFPWSARANRQTNWLLASRRWASPRHLREDSHCYCPPMQQRCSLELTLPALMLPEPLHLANFRWESKLLLAVIQQVAPRWTAALPPIREMLQVSRAAVRE